MVDSKSRMFPGRFFYKVFVNVRRQGFSCIISSLRPEGRILQNDTVDFIDGPEV